MKQTTESPSIGGNDKSGDNMLRLFYSSALLCCVIGLLGLCLSAAPVSAAENSARRTVFEDGFEKQMTWLAWPGGRQRGEIVAESPKRGASALKLHSDPKPIIYVYINVREHTRYSVCFWLKNKGAAGRLGLNLNFNRQGGGNGSAGRRSHAVEIPEKHSDWKRFETSFVTPPATATLQLGLDFTRTSGEIWLDDVTVDEVEILLSPQNLVPFLRTTTPEVVADRAAFLFTTSADHIASASPDMPSMITFKAFNKAHKPRLVLDLPDGLELLNGIRHLTISPPAQIERGEKTFNRYTVTQSRPAPWFRIFWTTTLAPETATTVFYRAEWDGGRQEEQRLPVEIVAIPPVSPPQHLITYAPLLSAGFPFAPYHCDISARMVKWQVLEAVAGGARGFGFWGVCPLDARDMRSIRDAIATILPVEEVLASGNPTSDFTAINGRVLVKGIRSEKGTVVLVSEYSRGLIEDDVKCPVTRPAEVFELPSMRPRCRITPDNPVFHVQLDEERAKLFFVGDAL